MTVSSFARRWWSGQLGVVGSALNVLLAPTELVYRAAMSLRNGAYSSGALPMAQATIAVISVGNIAVGGTGKTPFTNFVARVLRAHGANPAIVHGGYADDEPALHRRWSPDIPVIANRDRVAAVRAAAQRGADIVVLDDAFQHRRLRRDLDIVLVAAERLTGTLRLLPRGPWRESLSALRRADIIVCARKTGSAAAFADLCASLAARVDKPIVQVHLHADGWQQRGAPAAPPVGPVLVTAGLADPELFEAAARAAGAHVTDALRFPDHHPYTAADATRIMERAGDRQIVTTEKDWTKLERHLDPTRVWLLTQSVVVEQGAEVLDAALARFRR